MNANTIHNQWMPAVCRRFHQDPSVRRAASVEVAAIADACWRAFTLTGDPDWSARVVLALDWFEGRNDSLQARIDRIDDRQEQMEARLVSTEKRLRAQYEALDRSMGQLSGLSSYMSQQLQALNNFYTARSGG